MSIQYVEKKGIIMASYFWFSDFKYAFNFYI